jgi:hypothetical protein
MPKLPTQTPILRLDAKTSGTKTPAKPDAAIGEPRGKRAELEVYGIRPFPSRGGIVTNELIDQLRNGCVD